MNKGSIPNQSLHEPDGQNDQMFARLFNNLPGFAYKCKLDKNWTMLFMSEGCKNVTGYDSEELIGNKLVSYSEIIHKDDRQFVEDSVKKGFREKNTLRWSTVLSSDPVKSDGFGREAYVLMIQIIKLPSLKVISQILPNEK